MTGGNGPEGRLVVIGGGGHAGVVIDVARAAGFTIVAALDGGAIGKVCNGVEVVGDDSMALQFLEGGVGNAVVALGDNTLRFRIGDSLRALGFRFPAIVHPSAVISPSAEIGAGTVVMPAAVINAGATVGEFAIINTAAVVEHDCVLGDGSHIAPGTVLGGCVTVGKLAFIGIGSAARPQSIIGERAVIGAGSTVIGTIEADSIVMGSPARDRRAP